MWFKNLFLRKFLASDSNEAFVPDAKFKHPDKAAEIKVEDFNLWFGDAHIPASSGRRAAAKLRCSKVSTGLLTSLKTSR